MAIWLFSTGSFDAPTTTRILTPLMQWLLPWASEETIATIHLAVRKSAHFFEYFVLAILVHRGVRAGRVGWQRSWAMQTVALVTAYAAVDEVHQMFVPTRSAAVRDVLLDSVGGAVAILVLWRMAQRKKRRPAAP